MGSAHLHRMQILASLLAPELSIELFDLSAHLLRDQSGGFELSNKSLQEIRERCGPQNNHNLHIVDLRDIDPEVFCRRNAGKRTHTNPVLFLDNRHRRRELWEASSQRQCLFYDTLPHPKLSTESIQKQLWIPQSKEAAHEKRTGNMPRHFMKKSGSALVYTGTLEASALLWLSDYLLGCVEEGGLAQITQVGCEPLWKDLEMFHYHYFTRLSSQGFSSLIRSSEYVFSYFGLSLFEAWVESKDGGPIPVLYEIDSDEHRLLSDDLSRRAGIYYLKQDFAHTRPMALLPGTPPPILPASDGQTHLLGFIRGWIRNTG